VVESGDEFNSGDDQLNIRVNQKITYVRMNDHKKIWILYWWMNDILINEWYINEW